MVNLVKVTGERNSSVLSLPLMASYTNPLFIPATLVSIFLNNAGLCISVHERFTDISPHSVLFPEKKSANKEEKKIKNGTFITNLFSLSSALL